MQLCWAWGRTLADVGDEMSAPEHALWRALWRIHPRPDSWLQAGVIAAGNAWLWGNKSVRPQDYMPTMKRERTKPQSAAEQMAALSLCAPVRYSDGR
jgi:hypothetical protein